MSSIDRWIDQNIGQGLPADIIKKARLKSEEPPKQGFRSVFEDPYSLQSSMGYKERNYSLDFDFLKRIPQRLSLVGAIMQTRCNQVAQFSIPFRTSKSVGYVVKHKDPGKLTTKAEQKFIAELEAFIYNCGHKKPNPHNKNKRDDFETFLKKIVRDSLTFDQLTFETIPDRRGIPYEFMAVDASTIRLAAEYGVHAKTDDDPWGYRKFGPFQSMQLFRGNKLDKDSKYVQLVNGQIETIYTEEELAFGVRNPRTDIQIQGYGYGELENLVSIITSHLNAESYNKNFFQSASAPKGILNFRGETMTPDMLEAFRRQWKAQVEGVTNSWSTPMLQSEAGIDWIDLHPTNRDMEYNAWIEYLIKITCAVFLIDPAELNFDLHGGVQQTPLFESSQEWKLKASRDRGLKPLLRFIAKMINEHVISKIDDHFIFEFVGLDELTENEKHTLRTEQVSTYRTLNEIRREDDLPDLEYGNIPLSPVYLQAMQISAQQEAQQNQSPTDQGNDSSGAEDNQPTGNSEPEEGNTPRYSDSFNKSLKLTNSQGKFLEIDLSELDGWKSRE